MHFNALGGDGPGKTELHRGVLAAASVFVEFEPQTRLAGGLQQRPADSPVTEFWCVLAGLAPGRSSDTQVRVFDSVGFALEDPAALTWMGETAADLGIGDLVQLVPQALDPKNLFGELKRVPQAPALVSSSVKTAVFPVDELA